MEALVFRWLLKKRVNIQTLPFLSLNLENFRNTIHRAESPPCALTGQEKLDLSSGSGGRKPRDHAATGSKYISDQIAQCDSDIEVFALMERLMDDYNVPSFLLLKTTNSESHSRKFEFLLSNISRSATDFLEQTALFDNICMLHDNDRQITQSAVRYNFLNLLTSPVNS